jgi:putative transposon-encoded protein
VQKGIEHFGNASVDHDEHMQRSTWNLYVANGDVSLEEFECPYSVGVTYLLGLKAADLTWRCLSILAVIFTCRIKQRGECARVEIPKRTMEKSKNTID